MQQHLKQETANVLLVLRAQLKEERAFTELLRQHSGPVYSYLRRLVGDASAEDVLQQVWLKVHRQLHRLEEPRAFKGWLYRIAHSEACSLLRRIGRQAQATSIGDALRASLEEPSTDPVAILSVQQALDRLAPAHQELLRLRFELGLTYEELAESLQINVGTVRSRLHTSKDKLRSLIQGGLPE